MIDEAVLEELLNELAREIDIPADGAERVIQKIDTSVRATRRRSPRVTRLLLVAAVLIVIGGLALLMRGNGTNHKVLASGTPNTPTAQTPTANPRAARSAAPRNDQARSRYQGHAGAAVGLPDQGPVQAQHLTESARTGGATAPAVNGTNDSGASSPTTVPTQSPTGPIEGALVVKTGSLDLQVPHDALRPTFNRVTSTVVGLGGYVVNETANFSGSDPTGTITVRVPVNLFERAVSDVNGLPGVKVLSDRETGKDVTAQYVNVQAQITALTTEEQSLLKLLAQANNLNDITTLQGQITGVRSQIDQLQGQNNLLRNEAAYSDLAITATEALAKGQKAPASHHAATGLSKSWSDATSGFARSVEWFIARSGAALILFLAALILVFGLRYLYPVLRRALL